VQPHSQSAGGLNMAGKQKTASGPLRGPAQTLAKGLDVLRLLGEENFLAGASVSQISDRLGITPSSTYRYLVTLVRHGWVVQDRHAGAYRLGYQVLRLAVSILDSRGLRAVASPVLQTLAAKVKEAVHLNVMDGDVMVLIDRIDSVHPVRLHLPVGSVSPLHCTASGKAMLARLGNASLDRLLGSTVELPAQTSRTITRTEDLRAELSRIRHQGYATDDRESNEDVRCIAAAVTDYQGSVAGAISVSAPASRMSMKDARRLAPDVMEAAGEISRRLGLRQ
jgi:DNA-binding IclR family transcriptional regulator